MLIIFRNIRKLSCYKPNIRFISFALWDRKSFETEMNTRGSEHAKSFSTSYISITQNDILSPYRGLFTQHQLEVERYYSKKKGSKRNVEVEEESSDDDEEEEYQETLDKDDFSSNIVKKSLPSLRLDSILKGGLGITKKKIEKEFYAGRVRVNGNAVLKKAFSASVGDEVDLIKGFSPDTNKFLIVDRVIVKSIGKVGGTSNFPVSMEVLKALTIPNYEHPWSSSSVGEIIE